MARNHVSNPVMRASISESHRSKEQITTVCRWRVSAALTKLGKRLQLTENYIGPTSSSPLSFAHDRIK
jgi:hypothetical protein